MINMKTGQLFGLLLFLSMISCSKEKLQPTAEELDLLLPLAKSTTMQVMKEMMVAAKAGGPVAAIKFCSLRAMSFTKKLAEDEILPIEIKRSSDKLRNPINNPDELEQQILDKFNQAVIRNEDLPEHFVQKFERDGTEYLRYYQPIMVDNRCLTCHGLPENLDPDVKTILNENYPLDMAMGYEEGDFRGFIRLEVESSKLIEVGR